MTQVVDFRIGEELREKSAVLAVDVGQHGLQLQRVLVDSTVAEELGFDPLLFHENPRRLLREEDVLARRGAEVERVVSEEFVKNELGLVESFDFHLFDEGDDDIQLGRREADLEVPRLRVVERVEEVQRGGLLLEEGALQQDHLHNGEELAYEFGQLAVGFAPAEDLLEVHPSPLANEVAECQVAGGHAHDQFRTVVPAALRYGHAHRFGSLLPISFVFFVHSSFFNGCRCYQNAT